MQRIKGGYIKNREDHHTLGVDFFVRKEVRMDVK